MPSQAGEAAAPAPRPLQTLNLNLLVPLEALLRRRSVSRAAEDLHLSQPSVSESLARLRRHFGDELLKREGRELVLTPFAASLVPHVEQAVRALRAVFDGNAVFDPARSSREFVIAAVDVWVRVVGPPLWRAVHEQAPGVRLDFRALSTTRSPTPTPTASCTSPPLTSSRIDPTRPGPRSSPRAGPWGRRAKGWASPLDAPAGTQR